MTDRQPLWQYVWNLVVGADQFANAATGGDPDETISSRAAKRRATCRPCYWLCRLLDFFDPGHCDRVTEPDEGKDAVL